MGRNIAFGGIYLVIIFILAAFEVIRTLLLSFVGARDMLIMINSPMAGIGLARLSIALTTMPKSSLYGFPSAVGAIAPPYFKVTLAAVLRT